MNVKDLEVGKTYKLTNGNFLTIEYSEYSDSPRTWCENGVAYITRDTHRHYGIAKKDSSFESYEIVEAVEEWLSENPNGLCFPIVFREHSQVALSTYLHKEGDDLPKEWGYLLFTKEELEWTEDPEAFVTSLVDTWEAWLNGYVYSFLLKDAGGNVIDSCGGHYDMEDLLDHAGIKPEDVEREAIKAWR